MNEEKILATVGNVSITEADVDAFINSLPQEQKMYAQNPQFRQQCVDQLVAMNLFSMLGEDEKLDETAEFDKYITSARREILARLAMQKVFSAVEVSADECKAFYEQNPQFFQQGESVSAKHILVKEEAECIEVLESIKGGEAFEDAAKRVSTCPSKERGGDLGAFSRGQMVPEFEEAAFAAEIGALVGPVKTQFGYHLIKVENKTEASVVPFEQVAPQISLSLQQQKQGEAYAAKVEELKAKYLG
ncbi:MAG: peptidylprolyl isomerase [Clostridia bacterium]|nr:peptidylprolyl isomerase [Clostridia bacterium]